MNRFIKQMQATAIRQPIEVSPAPGESDESLMLRYAQNEPAAFDELFSRHHSSVLAFIRGFVPATQEAEDLLQQVFLRVIRNRERYQPTAKFTTWLYTITRSVCIDSTRKRKPKAVLRIVHSRETGEQEIASEEIAGSDICPRQTLHESTLRERIEQALQTIPETQREVFLLRENTTLTFAEMGAMLGCSENTVKSRMHYALLALRSKLEEMGITP